MRGWAVGVLCVACEAPYADVGEACHETLPVPELGFRRTGEYLHVGSASCDSDYCLVNEYEGDLIDSRTEGNGWAEFNGDGVLSSDEVARCGEECGWTGVKDRIYCTCKCGVMAGGDPHSITCDACPRGFTCCPLFDIGEIAGDYCVLDGTCERAR